MAELRPRVVRVKGGGIALRLTAPERAILGASLSELREIVGPLAGGRPEDVGPVDAGPDPALDRLYPTAIPGDAVADAAFRDLTRADLEETRRGRIAVMEATLDAGSLDDGQATAWMGALNDLRLVLGTRLGVTDESETRPIDEDDPDADRRIVFAYLGWLLGQFVDVLEAGLPAIDDQDGDRPTGSS